MTTDGLKTPLAPRCPIHNKLMTPTWNYWTNKHSFYCFECDRQFTPNFLPKNSQNEEKGVQ